MLPAKTGLQRISLLASLDNHGEGCRQFVKVPDLYEECGIRDTVEDPLQILASGLVLIPVNACGGGVCKMDKLLLGVYSLSYMQVSVSK